MTINLPAFYDRSEEEQAKGYQQHLFRAGNVLQSAELNELQAYSRTNLAALGDALYKDGDIIRDARAIVDSLTGATQLESGAIYLRGQVRGVPVAQITIPITGTVVIGVYLSEVIVTEKEDDSLLDPARETRSYQEPGAARLQVITSWGYQGDGSSTGDFYPVYYVDVGVLRAKDAPPEMDSVSQAIARYDRDSAGTSYIVSGMTVSQLDDDADGNQVYAVKDGRARVNGFGITLSAARRLVYPAVPDLRYIDSEPHASTTAAAQRIDLFRTPLSEVTTVRITAEKTVSLVHGTVVGAQDPLPDTSVIDIVSVTQGTTTYTKGTDFNLTAGKVDWTPTGAEPAPGSTYSVTYQYIAIITPTDMDDNGFTVTGAVPGSLILINYYCKLPRIDRLCIDESGAFLWVTGVATDYSPVRPQVPSNVLAICQISQTWTSSRSIISDGVKMTSMSDLGDMKDRLELLTDLIAQQELKSDVSTREAAAQKGLFVDPFLNDDQRDQGLEQSLAITGGALTLAIDGVATSVSADVTEPSSCAYTLKAALSQTLRTGSMNINPYMAFGIVPANIVLTPAVDRWTEIQTTWTSAKTEQFTSWAVFGTHRWGSLQAVNVTTSTQLVSQNTSLLQYLRQIEVKFEIAGFGPGEILSSATFDGIAVVPTAQ